MAKFRCFGSERAYKVRQIGGGYFRFQSDSTGEEYHLNAVKALDENEPKIHLSHAESYFKSAQTAMCGASSSAAEASFIQMLKGKLRARYEACLKAKDPAERCERIKQRMASVGGVRG